MRVLNKTRQVRSPGVTATSVLLIAGIVTGALIGYGVPQAGQQLGGRVDYTLLVLVGLLLFGVRFGALLQAATNLRFIAIALVANFMLIPLIGYGVASLVLGAHPLFMLSAMIYFMSPCTDWFLGFTRLSGGNVALGATLLPINMTVQLLLYPLYLSLFNQSTVPIDMAVIGQTLWSWFVVPLVGAVAAHQALHRLLSTERFDRVLATADTAVAWVLALLVLQIFAGNIAAILAHRSVFAWVLLAVFLFFVLTFLLGEAISRLCRLAYPEHALLTMTTAARNAPLMLAVTMTALPGQALVYAALIIGMLVEFPHLTALRGLLLTTRRRRDLEHSCRQTGPSRQTQ